MVDSIWLRCYHTFMKPLSKINYTWTSKLAYAIGLIATDGNLSSDERHINFTSKDLELAEIFRECIGFKGKIGIKSGRVNGVKKYFVVQPGDVVFYKFLESIGLTKKKSKTLGKLKIPRKLFYDFLRGCLDGDGSFNAFFHPQSKIPQFRVRLYSASKIFVDWIKRETLKDGINSYLTNSREVHILGYGKKDSTKLLNLVYYGGCPKSLSRKYEYAKKYIKIDN